MTSARLLAIVFGGLLLTTTGCIGESESDAGVESQVAEANEATSMLASGIEKRRYIDALEANASSAELQRATVHFGNAYWLAYLSELAYLDKKEITRALTKAGVKYQQLEVIENGCTGASALYVRMNGYGVIAFRGTEPTAPEDLWTDLDATKVEWEGPGRVHHGFLEQYVSILKNTSCRAQNLSLEDVLVEHHATKGGDNGPLYVTGHSLGGALATMLVASAQTTTCPDPVGTCLRAPALNIAALYTFGSPKVGDETFANVVADRSQGFFPIYRFVHDKDVVTGVPRNVDPVETAVEGDYTHLSPHMGDESTLQVWIDGDEAVIAERVDAPRVSFSDHAVHEGYVRTILGLAKTRKEIR